MFRTSSKSLPRPMKPISSDIAVPLLKSPEGKVTAGMDRQYYKNVSIYFFELPATPSQFLEKYHRDYTQMRRADELPSKEFMNAVKQSLLSTIRSPALTGLVNLW